MFVKLFSVNPKLGYLFFGVFDFFKYDGAHFKNILVMFICDIGIFFLKRIIKKERPMKYNSTTLARLSGLGPDAYSFPSAHSFTAFQLTTFLVLTFKHVPLFVGIIALYPLIVGYSRVNLKHHFFIDVFAGATLGIISGLLNYSLL